MSRRGESFFSEGLLNFPAPTPEELPFLKLDGSYHTAFGFGASHNGEVFGNTDPNVRLAATRLFKSRLPTIPGFEPYMHQRQHQFISTHQPFFTNLANTYASHFEEYSTAVYEAVEHHGDPHPKAALRIAAWKDLLEFNFSDDGLWYLPGKGTLYKMKIFEVAKPGKPPRMIGDLGVHASLQGFRITKFLKHAMAHEPIEYEGGLIEFCPKPDPASLARVFAHLIDPPGKFYFVYFSDDSCVAIRTPDGVKRYNVDISSCDASHTESLFTLLNDLVPPLLREDVNDLVRQCRTPITIHSKVNGKKSVTLTPHTPRLYSGSTLTTAINNLANICIGISIAEGDCRGPDDIVRAAARTGYIVTCDDATDWHKLQFLKHSPVLDTNGVLRPLLNLGVLIRLSGTCKGDLPGKKTTPLRVRGEAFQDSLLRGAHPHAEFNLLTNMRSRCTGATVATQRRVAQLLAYKVCEDASYPPYTVNDSEVFQRYELDDREIVEVNEGFGLCGFGEHYHSSGLHKIFQLDYGLSGKEFGDDCIPSG